MNIIQTLSQRGLISQKSDNNLEEILKNPASLYIGFDPTAESMHIGNLLQIILLSHFQQHGHRPICVVGAGTAMIGDPSGKSQERNLLDTKTIEKNMVGMKRQLQLFLDFDCGDKLRPHGQQRRLARKIHLHRIPPRRRQTFPTRRNAR